MTTGASAFGVSIPLPMGWVDETVHVFSAPALAATLRPTSQQPPRTSMSAVRVAAANLEAGIEQLGTFAVADVAVLLDEMRQEGGRVFYERVGRFADPTIGSPLQQAARVYHHGQRALIVVLTTPAIAFKACYDDYSRFAAALSEGAL
jgi:hypothetical protein